MYNDLCCIWYKTIKGEQINRILSCVCFTKWELPKQSTKQLCLPWYHINGGRGATCSMTTGWPRTPETHDGRSQQGKGETASQPTHDTAIRPGLAPFGGEEGSLLFVAAVPKPPVREMTRGVNEASQLLSLVARTDAAWGFHNNGRRIQVGSVDSPWRVYVLFRQTRLGWVWLP